MGFKNHLLILLTVVFAACNKPAPKSGHSKNFARSSYIDSLKENKEHIDSFRKNKKRLIVLVKVKKSDHLQIVKNGMFPDSVETTYNILKDNAGHVVRIMESPYSESGDWDILYYSYFDIQGRLFSFERIAGFFNSECTGPDDEAAHEDLAKFFDKKNKLLDSTYTLTDSNNRPLKKSSCTLNYDYPYKIIYRLNDYLKTNKIDLKQLNSTQ